MQVNPWGENTVVRGWVSSATARVLGLRTRKVFGENVDEELLEAMAILEGCNQDLEAARIGKETTLWRAEGKLLEEWLSRREVEIPQEIELHQSRRKDCFSRWREVFIKLQDIEAEILGPNIMVGAHGNIHAGIPEQRIKLDHLPQDELVLLYAELGKHLSSEDGIDQRIQNLSKEADKLKDLLELDEVGLREKAKKVLEVAGS